MNFQTGVFDGTQSTRRQKHVIESALARPAEDRLAILNAIHVSLADAALDHGKEDTSQPVQAAWKNEIAKRLADLDDGKVNTVPAELAEQMIRGDARPSV